MGFYEDLSPYYDEVFAVDEAEMHFVSNQLRDQSHILDIGCGTGNKTIFLSTPGKTVTAVDQDSAMLLKARESNARPNIRYQQADMANLKQSLGTERFDGVVCLGNTLVHLPSAAAIGSLLQTVSDLMRTDGVCIVQILNYDRILDQGIRDLPFLETPHTRFARRYEPSGDKLLFVTDLEIKETGAVFHNEIPLYPLRGEELAAMLSSAGFMRTEYFGSYQGAALQTDSFVTIAVCGKSVEAN